MREETTTSTKPKEVIVYDMKVEGRIKKFIDDNWDKMPYEQLIEKIKEMGEPSSITTDYVQIIKGSEVTFVSEAVCLKLGGHCWVDEDAVGASNPPTYFRRCKHCNKRQYGRRQEAFEWKDWK